MPDKQGRPMLVSDRATTALSNSMEEQMKKTGYAVLCSVIALAAAGAWAQSDTQIVLDGSTTVGPIAKAFAEYYMGKNPGVNVTVSESGSGNGAKAIINGTAQIGTLSRKMKEEELEAAKEKGVDVVEHIVAMDGIAAIVHLGNPVQGLTKEQLKQVYMGEITNWKELGGPDKEIVIISRDTNSGTYESFQNLVMKSERVTDSAEYVGSNGAIRQRVMTTEGAIGYVGLAFTEGVKVLEVDGILPTPDTVNDHTYPIARPLFMYTNGEPAEGTHLASYLNLYKTDDGRKIIDEQGFVSVP
jgi:phosphate transport system substrate-binding protein